MAVFANFISIFTQVLTVAIFIRVLLSWFPINPGNPLVVLLHQITEPVLAPLRRIVPRVGLFDFSPMVAILLLQALSYLVSAYY